MSGSVTFTSDNGEQEELRAEQKRKTIQKETTTDPRVEWGGAGGQMGCLPLTWAESGVFADEEMSSAVDTIDDLQLRV